MSNYLLQNSNFFPISFSYSLPTFLNLELIINWFFDINILFSTFPFVNNLFFILQNSINIYFVLLTIIFSFLYCYQFLFYKIIDFNNNICKFIPIRIKFLYIMLFNIIFHIFFLLYFDFLLNFINPVHYLDLINIISFFALPVFYNKLNKSVVNNDSINQSSNENGDGDDDLLKKLKKLLNSILSKQFLYSIAVIILVITIMVLLGQLEGSNTTETSLSDLIKNSPNINLSSRLQNKSNKNLILNESLNVIYPLLVSLLSKLDISVSEQSVEIWERRELLKDIMNTISRLLRKDCVLEFGSVDYIHINGTAFEEANLKFTIDFTRLKNSVSVIRPDADLSLLITQCDEVANSAKELNESGSVLFKMELSLEEKKQLKFIIRMSKGIEKAFNSLLLISDSAEFNIKLKNSLKTSVSFCDSQGEFVIRLFNKYT